MTAGGCPACGSPWVESFYEQHRVPVHSCLLLDDPVEAREFPTGSIVLAFCEECGFITNTAFDATLHQYSERYEETQEFSPRFQRFARELSERWIERYDLRRGHVLEIGCGKGSFLKLMCDLGPNRGTGIDPSFVPGRVQHEGITFVREFFDETYGAIHADAVICRHTLEHIAPVGSFLRAVRAGIGDRTDTVVLFELPDVRRVLDEGAFWDVYYEHCSYFTAGSLLRTFRATGFEVLDVSSVFDDQYLVMEAIPAGASPNGALVSDEDDLEDLRGAVQRFTTVIERMTDRARDEIARAAAAGMRVAIWGSGSKGVAYLTTLGLASEVSYVIDVNPHKQGRFMAGTGHQIVAPEQLKSAPPDLVVVMNPVYRGEIRTMLDDLNINAELVST